MNKREIFQTMKSKTEEGVFVILRNGDYFEAYFSDAEELSTLLDIPVTITDGTPTLQFHQDTEQEVLSKIFAAGRGVSISQMRNKDGVFTAQVEDNQEVLHLYDD